MQPVVVFVLVVIAGTGLACAGIFLLYGAGWALLVGAVPFLLLAAVLARGLTRAAG